MNDAGRQSIIDKFYEAYGERHPWRKFGIKFTTCKKQYESFRKLTHNRTGLGWHSNGSINMSEDWWNDRCKVCRFYYGFQKSVLTSSMISKSLFVFFIVLFSGVAWS